MHSYSTIWYAHTHFFFGMLSHIFRQNRMNHITNPWGSAMAAAGVLKALESVSWDATHELCSIVRHLKIPCACSYHTSKPGWYLTNPAGSCAEVSHDDIRSPKDWWSIQYRVVSRLVPRNSGILGCSNLWRLREVAPDWNSNMIMATLGLSTLLKLFHTGRRKIVLSGFRCSPEFFYRDEWWKVTAPRQRTHQSGINHPVSPRFFFYKEIGLKQRGSPQHPMVWKPKIVPHFPTQFSHKCPMVSHGFSRGFLCFPTLFPWLKHMNFPMVKTVFAAARMRARPGPLRSSRSRKRIGRSWLLDTTDADMLGVLWDFSMGCSMGCSV